MAGLNALQRRPSQYEQEESWKEPHDEVMRNHDTADALREEAKFGVYIYQQLRDLHAETFEESKLLYEVYLRWYKQSQQILSLVEDSERMGFPVEGIDPFRAAVKEAELLISTVTERIQVLESFIASGGTPAEQFIDQL